MVRLGYGWVRLGLVLPDKYMYIYRHKYRQKYKYMSKYRYDCKCENKYK